MAQAQRLWDKGEALNPEVLAYTVGPICALYLVGTFWPRANRQGANAGLIAGTLLFLGWGFVASHWTGFLP